MNPFDLIYYLIYRFMVAGTKYYNIQEYYADPYRTVGLKNHLQ
jgi:hypothetical protein